MLPPLQRSWRTSKYAGFLALPWGRITERTVLVFLVCVLLWKGGKGLEATWLLTALAWLATFAYWGSKPKEDPVPTFIWFFLFAFVGLTIMSWLKSTTQNYGFDEMLRTGSLVLIFFWMVRTVHERKGGRKPFLDRLISVLVAATLVAGLVGLMVYFFQPVERFVGTFFDYRFHTDYWPNAWADWLLLVWPMVALWTLKDGTFVISLFRYFVFGLVVGFLFLSYSRGALVAFGGQLVLWSSLALMLHWGKRTFPWKDASMKTAFSVVVAVAIFFAANSVRSQYFPVQSVGEKLTFTAAERGSSVSERAQFWNQAWVLSLQKPLTGWGPSSFRFVQPRLQQGVRATSDHPHNIILKFAVERGWVAALIFLILVATILVRGMKTYERKQHAKHTLFLIIGLAGLLAHSLIDFNLQFVGIALVFWLMLASLTAEIEWGRGIRLNLKFVRFFEVVLATFLLIAAVNEARGILLSSFGRHAEARGEMAQALMWYELTAAQWMSRDMHLSRAHILYGQKHLEEAQSAVEDYLNENWEDYRAWRILGDILRMRREVDDALKVYEMAYDLGAKYNDFGVTRAWAELLMDANRWEELEKKKDEMTALMKEYVDAIERNAHFVSLSTNVEDVIDLANTFAEIHSRREAPLYQVLAARADYHSKMERERILSRPPGYLW